MVERLEGGLLGFPQKSEKYLEQKDWKRSRMAVWIFIKQVPEIVKSLSGKLPDCLHILILQTQNGSPIDQVSVAEVTCLPPMIIIGLLWSEVDNGMGTPRLDLDITNSY